MTDRIPNTPKIDRSKAIEEAARLKDVTDRARAARPVSAGSDILKGPFSDGTDGFRSTFGRDKRDPRRYNF
jgi:hypothetical protein